MVDNLFAKGTTYSIVVDGHGCCAHVVVISPSGVPGLTCRAASLDAMRRLVRLFRRAGCVRHG